MNRSGQRDAEEDADTCRQQVSCDPTPPAGLAGDCLDGEDREQRKKDRLQLAVGHDQSGAVFPVVVSQVCPDEHSERLVRLLALASRTEKFYLVQEVRLSP